MAKNAKDLLREMGNNPGKVTINGAVKARTKMLIDNLTKKTKLSNGEVIDAMAELFFEGAELEEDGSVETQVNGLIEEIEEAKKDLRPSSGPGNSTREAGPAVQKGSDHPAKDIEGTPDDDKRSRKETNVEPMEEGDRPLPNSDKGFDLKAGKERDPGSISGGNSGHIESSEGRSAADLANDGYPQNLEIF
jgi:hypothetical protein